MKRFLKEIVGYGFLMLIFSIICSVVLYHGVNKDFYKEYEDPTLNSKLNFFLEDNKFNTAFVGTSKTLRQIDTKIFSDYFGKKISAFNMGVIGLFPFRMNDFAERVSTKKRLKYLFIEIAPIDRVGSNYDYNPNILALSPSRFFTLLDYLKSNQIKLKTKLGYIVHYSRAFTYKYLGLGGSKQLLLLSGANKPEVVPSYNDNNDRNGFSPFDPLIKKGHFSKNMLKGSADLKKNPTQITRVIASYKTAQENLNKTTDRFLLSIEKLAVSISEKGVTPIFVVPPRQMDYGLSPVLNQKNYLKEKGFHVFDFSDPEEYPALYLVENSFDLSHLNEKGATIYTNNIISKFEEILND